MLQLRTGRRRRHTIADVRVTSTSTAATTPRWYTDFLLQCYAMWLLLYRLSVPLAQCIALPVHVPPESRMLFNLLGHCPRRPVPIRQQALEARDRVAENMQGVHVIVWLNNFNELKYTCNPLRRNVSSSSTAFAVLNVIPWIPFGGYLTLKEIALRA